jgi:hypothetical protein
VTFTTTWRRPWPLPDPKLPGLAPNCQEDRQAGATD